MSHRIVLVALAAALSGAVPAWAQDAALQTPPAAEAPAGGEVMTVRNISVIELSPGLQIVDGSGQPIGTVKQVAGNTIVVTDGSADYRLPIEQLYAYREGAVDHFASRVRKSALTAADVGG